MITRTRKVAMSGLALVSSVALLAACSSAPSDSKPSASSDFKPCMVSDSGGFDDKSFNQLGFEGLQKASSALGATPITVESNAETDFGPNLQSLADQGCELIVSVGFALSAPTVEAALKNPGINYVLIDDAADNDYNGETDAPNIEPLLFDTAQAAFLVGYASAATTQSGVVGTFGGMNFPTVAIFMDGFKQGVEYYNSQNGKSVKVLGWDGKDGSFTGGFEANDTARQIAQSLIDQGADIILPVGGPIYQSAAAAIKSSGKEIALIGVDADITKTDPSVADIVLTSVLKKIDVAVNESVTAAGEGKFAPKAYVGNLANDGVGMAPLTNFSSWIPADLQKKVDELKAQIIDGKVKVTSYLSK
ncbi:MAG TPA: BMP family ABC transporter substrate-binding protein [Microbacteriaceae bacterium]|nr:BMP family ABC transporter substrate-binding protein [Microbacteriaceae bacterium]